MPRNTGPVAIGGSPPRAESTTVAAAPASVRALLVLFLAQWGAAMVGSVSGGVDTVDQSIAWFASGVGIAGVWLLGRRAVAAVVAATVAHRVASDYPGIGGYVEALGSGLEAWVGAALLRRCGLRPEFARLRDVLILAMVAAVAPLVSMTVAWVGRQIPAFDFRHLGFLSGWEGWWRMNAVGVLVVVPVALTWQARWRQAGRAAAVASGAIAVVLAAVVLATVVFAMSPSVSGITFAYSVSAVALFAALRLGPVGACSVGAFGSLFVALATIHGHGPFQCVPLHERHAAAQIFALTLVAVPLVIGALIAERTESARMWASSEGARQGLLALLPDATVRASADGRVRAMHVPAGQELLLPRTPRLGEPLTASVDADVRARLAEAFAFAVAGRRPESTEFTLPRPNGERACELRCVPAGDGEVLVVVRDVTARRDLEAQLRHAQKLEAVGLLAGGVAHDFNNLLTVVLGNAEELRRAVEPTTRSLADEIVEAARRGADLTRQLLAFSRQQALAPEALELGSVVARLSPLLRRLLGSAIVVETVAASPAWVRADRGQLEQVLMNLAVNARDAMPDGGRLHIATRGDVAAAVADLEVRDSGVGMTPAVRARAFEPFFTTKETGRGTGLGLATVYGIVQQSGGTVAIDSTPGAGTVVRVRLPAIAPAATA